MKADQKPIIEILKRRKASRVPFWLMRQAGRYLPEYRELRSKAGSFLNLVYDPEMAAEVTVQPLRRFGMDAAILFSDILVVPHALGQDVAFEAGEGPKLDPIRSETDFRKLSLENLESKAVSVYETVLRTAQKMKQEGFRETALIGFCGSPWTVLCYMVEGKGSKDFEKTRLWALSDPVSFQKLVDIMTEASCVYLAGQIRAGAEIIQLFDSWSGLLDGEEFTRWVIEPTKKIRKYLLKNFPHVPVIGFPRGAGVMAAAYTKDTSVDCIGLDQTTDIAWAVNNIFLPLQGNLDPVRLLAGGRALEEGMEKIRSSFGTKPFIFNLGHGVIKETPIAHIEKLRDTVRSWSVS
jgi:uroporphyrinogen decarboxylase